MQGTFALTDHGWYKLLSRQGPLPEVNFWKPSAHRTFKAQPGSPFFFKLRAPHRAVCGFGHFAMFTRLPVWLAWELFGIGNGCSTGGEMRARVEGIRERIRFKGNPTDAEIGCILIAEPVFFPPDLWVRQPVDWPVRTQSDKKYDLDSGEGRRVWEQCIDRAEALRFAEGDGTQLVLREPRKRYGRPQLVAPRIGQGTFRALVTDAYGRGCAITNEHSLPALEAAHIRPYADDGPHDVRNGLLLRADIHRLFDQGYVTVTPELKIEVSGQLRAVYRNGRTYYPYHGADVRVPRDRRIHPAAEFLTWHNEKVFRG